MHTAVNMMIRLSTNCSLMPFTKKQATTKSIDRLRSNNIHSNIARKLLKGLCLISKQTCQMNAAIETTALAVTANAGSFCKPTMTSSINESLTMNTALIALTCRLDNASNLQSPAIVEYKNLKFLFLIYSKGSLPLIVSSFCFLSICLRSYFQPSGQTVTIISTTSMTHL